MQTPAIEGTGADPGKTALRCWVSPSSRGSGARWTGAVRRPAEPLKLAGLGW